MSVAFYFDFISPYAYLAWFQIHDLADKHGRSVTPIPTLFAAMLNAYGHKGPAEIPPKRIYIFKNVLRLAHAHGIALTPPPAHPFNPLLALRIAGLDMPAEQQRRVIDALFRAVWSDGPGVTEPSVVAGVLRDAGLPGDDLVHAATEPDAKQRLRASTDAAVERGVFGVPTVIAGDELFWGLDAFPHLDAYLAGDDPVPGDLLDRWRDLPAQAKRPLA